MKPFHCDHCGSLVFFENVKCVSCSSALGFLSDVVDLSALEESSPGVWRALATPARDRLYRQCQNGRDYEVCNWLIPHDDDNPLCVSCRLNQTIPNLNIAGHLRDWFKMERAKRRLIYALIRMGLPRDGVPQQNRPALRFSFLSDQAGGPPVMNGHQNGLITLNIAEADDAEREKRRLRLHEPYRTLVGHFRHESGHYYWNQLIENTPHLGRFRELFGDETRDYGTALNTYYNQGPPADWPSRTVSAYASSHPWEDWAETWAHYLHITDSLETAAGYGMILAPKHPAAESMSTNPAKAGFSKSSFDEMLKAWIPLTYALNALNRGMGLADLYPFVLSEPAIEKLRFIHETVLQARKSGEASGPALNPATLAPG